MVSFSNTNLEMIEINFVLCATSKCYCNRIVGYSFEQLFYRGQRKTGTRQHAYDTISSGCMCHSPTKLASHLLVEAMEFNRRKWRGGSSTMQGSKGKCHLHWILSKKSHNSHLSFFESTIPWIQYIEFFNYIQTHGCID